MFTKSQNTAWRRNKTMSIRIATAPAPQVNPGRRPILTLDFMVKVSVSLLLLLLLLFLLLAVGLESFTCMPGFSGATNRETGCCQSWILSSANMKQHLLAGQGGNIEGAVLEEPGAGLGESWRAEVEGNLVNSIYQIVLGRMRA
jgi:hypothetical protein